MKTGIKPTNKYTFNRTDYKKGKTFGTGALDFENLVNIFYNIYIITSYRTKVFSMILKKTIS